MSENKEPMLVADDLVISMDYVLTVDGEILDSSEGTEPIAFLQGHSNIIPGLEKEIYGMAVDESRKVSVKPEEGYGVFDPDSVSDIPKSEFPDEIPLETGIELQMKDESGEIMHARITKVKKETVTLDFNHPLAGKTLEFDVKVVGIREATAEEIDHGHVHGEHGHHH